MKIQKLWLIVEMNQRESAQLAKTEQSSNESMSLFCTSSSFDKFSVDNYYHMETRPSYMVDKKQHFSIGTHRRKKLEQMYKKRNCLKINKYNFMFAN